MQNAFVVVGKRYSVAQINKAQDIIGDLQDELGLTNPVERDACEKVFNLLTECRDK